MVGHQSLPDAEGFPTELKLASRDHPYTRIFSPVCVFPSPSSRLAHGINFISENPSVCHTIRPAAKFDAGAVELPTPLGLMLASSVANTEAQLNENRGILVGVTMCDETAMPGMGCLRVVMDYQF
jgi:hypothetical protein